MFLHKILYFRIEKNVKWDKVEHFPALAIREISNNIFLVLYAIKTIVLNSRVKRSFFFLILAHSALFQIDFPQFTLRERKEKVEKKLVQTRGKCKKQDSETIQFSTYKNKITSYSNVCVELFSETKNR